MTDVELDTRLRSNLLALKGLQLHARTLQGLELPGVLALCEPLHPEVLFQQQVLYREPEALGPALPQLEAWYRAHGVPVWRVSVTPGHTAAERALEAAGYRPGSPVMAMGRELDAALSPSLPPSLPPGLTLEWPEDMDEVLTLNERCYAPGSMDFLASWRRPPLDPRMRAVLVCEGGRALSAGFTFEHEDAAGVYMIATHPEARRRGLGVRVMEALHADTLARGRRLVVLQASVDGLPLYQGLGYRALGEWINWVRSP